LAAGANNWEFARQSGPVSGNRKAPLLIISRPEV